MHFGLGPIGAAIVKQVAARPGFKIVGAIDIDPAKVGLGDYGKPGNYFDRQIGRWTKQYLAKRTTSTVDRRFALARVLGAPTFSAQEKDRMIVQAFEGRALPTVVQVVLSLGSVELANLMAVDTAFAVVMADLDFFKRLNDTMGHHAGDLLLREVGLRVRSVVGTDDVAAAASAASR